MNVVVFLVLYAIPEMRVFLDRATRFHDDIAVHADLSAGSVRRQVYGFAALPQRVEHTGYVGCRGPDVVPVRAGEVKGLHPVPGFCRVDPRHSRMGHARREEFQDLRCVERDAGVGDLVGDPARIGPGFSGVFHIEQEIIIINDNIAQLRMSMGHERGNVP